MANPVRGRRWWLLPLRVAGTTVLVVTATAVMLVVWDRTLGSRLWVPGNCVGPSGGSNGAYETVTCDSSAATGKIIETIRDPLRLLGAPPCPEETDATYSLGSPSFQTACVRNLRPPHPGDPGGGEGVVRIGDCLGSPTLSLNFREKPCADDGWYGKVVALVGEVTACPAASTLEAYEIPGADAPRRVACLGAGGEVLSPGDCVVDPSQPFGRSPFDGNLITVTCDSPEAWATVVDRVAAQTDCPIGTDLATDAPGAYRPVACLRALASDHAVDRAEPARRARYAVVRSG